MAPPSQVALLLTIVLPEKRALPPITKIAPPLRDEVEFATVQSFSTFQAPPRMYTAPPELPAWEPTMELLFATVMAPPLNQHVTSC